MKSNAAQHPLYLIHGSSGINRRTFLFTTASLATAALWSSRAFGAVTRLPVFSDYPFKLGVASGDPASDGFVLWTHKVRTRPEQRLPWNFRETLEIEGNTS